MHFHSKMAWPPATYDIISRNHSNWPSLNLSQNGASDKQTATENFRCWCFIVKEKNQKNLRGDGSRTPPPPLVPVCPRVKICLVFFLNITGKQSLTQDKKRTSFFISTIGNKVSMKRPFAKTTEQLQCSKAGNFTPDSGYMILYFQGVCLLIHLLTQKKYSLGLIPKHGVSTSARKSPLQLKECFCVVDLNLEKMKLMMQTHL